MRNVPVLKGLLFVAPMASLLAQTPALQMNVIYQCPAVQATLQVYSCTGPAAGDSCDVQTAPQGRPPMRGKSPRQQVMALLGICHPQTPAEAQAAARGGAAPANPNANQAANSGAVGPGGFKAGDRVRILADGWQEARVLQVRGNSYFVQLDNGIQVAKFWPMEVRRIGQLTAADHAAGQYDNHDRVQVQIGGGWHEGEIQGQQGNMYNIKVPGYRGDFGTDMYGTTPENIRMSTTPVVVPAKRAAGQSPKAGLVSCGSKYDGRWESTSGFGGLRFVFRSGKVTMTEGVGEGMVLDCFMGGGQVFLYEPGSFTEGTTLEVNNDGTLQTPLGTIKKMGN